MLPNEELYHSQVSQDPAKRWNSVPSVLETLKTQAKKQGLWNLWLSGGDFQGMAGGEGGGLTNLEVGHEMLDSANGSTLSWPRSWVTRSSLRLKRPTARHPTRVTWVCLDQRLPHSLRRRGPRAFRNPRAETEVPCPSPERRHPLQLLHDGVRR